MTQSIGPPSLAQGTRIAVGFSTSISRFIPACGELSKPSWAIVQLDGSSPLARGTQDLDRLGYVADRFIPAYAGNSTRGAGANRPRAVHPRLRGELLPTGNTSGSNDGSSPLTRGTHTIQGPLKVTGRFIPAYAGNSSSATYPSRSNSVHPRLRGELNCTALVLTPLIGSSPLTRGTLSVKRSLSIPRRFIPAYAGNSWQVIRECTFYAVHPRLRGELT